MQRSKGFFLVYELLCLGFTVVLLGCAAQGFTACLITQQKSLQLKEAWQAAQLAAAGLAAESGYVTEQEYKEQNGSKFLEVRVYASQNGRQLCSLVEGVP
ncbi:MAG: hypothetical protein ACI3XH_01590 [Phascolarctobacterium sp.]